MFGVCQHPSTQAPLAIRSRLDDGLPVVHLRLLFPASQFARFGYSGVTQWGAGQMGSETDNRDASAGRLPPVPRVALRPGYDISAVIKGGWQLAGDHGTVEPARAVADMVRFVDAGITAFDCADIYAGVEDMIGQFRAELLRTRGADAGASVRIHTKYVPDRESLGVLSLKQVETAIDRSLKRLGQDRLDLVQFHWWDYDAEGCEDAAGHLSRLREKGKIDLIGVTNFNLDHLKRLSDVTDIASAQVQYSLLDHRAGGDFAEFARENGIGILAYGTLAGGFLTDAWFGKPDPGFAFENRSLVKYRLIIEDFGGWSLFQDLLAALRRVADRHGTDISTIALRATLDSAVVTAAIVGARYADRLPHTLRAFSVELTAQDRNEIETVRSRAKGPSGPVFGIERDITGRHGRIMKYNLNKGDDRVAEAVAPREEAGRA